MKTVDIDNIKELEHAFAEDFSTPIFPVLANYYLQNRDMKRARKVCELGLEHNPHNNDGKFIFAKVNLYENKIPAGERLLKEVVKLDRIHVNGLRILVEVMSSLKRSPNSIIKYIYRILEILPEDEESLELLKHFNKSPKVKKPKNKNKLIKSNNKNTTIIEDSPKKPEANLFDVGMGMATFTMVNVLRAQKNYKQALIVLDRLNEKGADKKRIKKERSEIIKLFDSQ